jgi:cell division protease FtsH
LPEGDRISLSKEKLKADLAVAMGGRIAEEMIFGRTR